MDLRLFGRVMWRFRLVVGAGLVLALLLSFLTLFRVSLSHGLSLRTPPVYQASATLFVTQPGFPWGSAVQQYAPPTSGTDPVPSGDLNRLTALANLYVQIANGDRIAAVVARVAPRHALVSAAQGYSVSAGEKIALPTIVVNGTASSPAGAITTARAGVDALTTYVRHQQRVARILPTDRVVIQELNQPSKKTTTVVSSTKMTLPIVVFLAIMLAVTALAFALENLRPSGPRALPATPEREPRRKRTRRSA